MRNQMVGEWLSKGEMAAVMCGRKYEAEKEPKSECRRWVWLERNKRGEDYQKENKDAAAKLK